jgi:hypothetical protein
MNIKYIVGTVAVAATLGLGVHKGLSQVNAPVNTPNVPVGSAHPGLTVSPMPGYAPNYGPPTTDDSLNLSNMALMGYLDPDYYGYVNRPKPSVYNVSFGPYDIPRTTDSLTTRRLSGNRVSFQWQGEPRAVKNIAFALLDQNNKVIKQQVITSPPASSTLTRTVKTTAYSVTITYINGMTNTIISPL